ncbi:hypothetical protein [Bacillus sp. SG-1]|uniref:hypothetical protein n=1 Tax=Bacillus sp. SG-1 TaxID=161544 RepID=UPI0001544CE8|nr:hypothetical protein [Bacillus sp. SG-1]EDL64390.1 hypothetical protein BSG1_21560 [Bacillus sp. SG-1]
MSSTEKKKINLAQAMKEKLAQKKEQSEGKRTGIVKSTQPLKSQLTKKPNNQKKRTGV